jgi:hypothetical protein
MQIKQDIFPAHLQVAQAGLFSSPQDMRSTPPMDETYYLSKTRIVVTDKQIIVAHDSNTGPVIVFREEYVQHNKSNVATEDSYVVTVTGKMLVFSKDVNCGCGSRLRGWNPYKHLYSTKDPTT